MKKIKAYFEDFDASVLTTRRTLFFEILAALLGGIVLGILMAPPQKFKLGCGNGNTTYKAGKDGKCKDECCGDEEDCCCKKEEK